MADWRSLFSTSPNQTLAYHSSEIRNGTPQFGHSGLICAKKKQTHDEVTKEPVDTAGNNTTGKESVIENMQIVAPLVFDKKPAKPEAISNTHVHTIMPTTTPESSKNTKRKLNWSPNIKHSLTSSSNKYALLLDDNMRDKENEELIEYLEDKADEDNINEAWKHLVDNATYSPRKPRAASKGFAAVMNEVKGQKAKVVAKGGKKPKNQQ